MKIRPVGVNLFNADRQTDMTNRFSKYLRELFSKSVRYIAQV